MSLINLTEKFLKDHQVSGFKRRKILRDPDLYYATSIAEIEEQFSKNPPRQVGGNSLAKIIMQNIQIKVNETPDNGDDFRDAVEGVFQKREYIIRDPLGYDTLVHWISRESREFEEFQESLGINDRGFVTIPQTFLLYKLNNHGFNISDERIGVLRIYRIENNKPKQPILAQKELDYGSRVLQPI